MKKRLLASLLALCLVFALAACGEAPAAESGEPAAASEEPAGDLVAYELDGIGTAYLPAGGEVTLTPVTEPLPQMQATIAFEGFTVYIGSTGPEAYEISGVDFPASVEDTLSSSRATARTIITSSGSAKRPLTPSPSSARRASWPTTTPPAGYPPSSSSSSPLLRKRPRPRPNWRPMRSRAWAPSISPPGPRSSATSRRSPCP